MIKPAYPFQIARMECLRELLAVNSSSSAIITEGAPAATPTENQGGATMPTPAQQAIPQGIVEERRGAGQARRLADIGRARARPRGAARRREQP